MRRLLAAVAALFTIADAGLLYGLSTAATANVSTSFIVVPNATLVRQATAPLAVSSARQLAALGSGTTVLVLVANASTGKLDLIGVDLLTAAISLGLPTPLESATAPGRVGLGQQLAYMTTTGEVALFGRASASSATLSVWALSPITGALRVVVADLHAPSGSFASTRAALAGYDAASDLFFLPLLLCAEPSACSPVSVFIGMTTGAVSFQQGCRFDSVAYSVNDAVYVGAVVFTNASGVFRALAQVPANGTAACTISYALYLERSTDAPGLAMLSVAAYDNESRQFLFYASQGERPNDAATLVSVDVDTGALRFFPTSVSGTADILIDSAMCLEKGAACN